MTETDLAPTGTDEGFSAEEQAAMDAYERGDDAPLAGGEPSSGAERPVSGAAAPEAAGAPGEVVEPDVEAGTPEENKGKFVRHGAFHQERERRKTVERERDDLREKVARGDERMRLLTEAIQQRGATPAAAPVEAPKVPDPNEDIFGYVQHLQAEIAALRGGVQQQTESQRQEREAAVVVNDYKADLNRFAATEPAFADAFRHVMQSRAAEYAALGVPEAQIHEALGQDEFQIALQARQQGVSAAERIFQIAKARGFAPKAPEPAPAPAAPAESAADRAARVSAGQAGPGRSLSAAGGAPAGEVTLEALAAMNERDFEAFAAKNPRRLEQLMGAAA